MALVGALLCVASSVVPRPARPFESVSYDGRRVSLEALKGRVGVVMFFSTDCPHCQQVALQIDPIYRSLQAQGFEIVGLSLNPTDRDGLRGFAKQFDVSFPLARSSRYEFARVTGIPLTTRIYYPYILFLDKNGIIREEHQGSEHVWSRTWSFASVSLSKSC